MTLDEVKTLIEKILERGKKKYEEFDITLIRLLNGANWVSFTSENTYNDYYNGKVKEVDKFDNVFYVELTCNLTR